MKDSTAKRFLDRESDIFELMLIFVADFQCEKEIGSDYAKYQSIFHLYLLELLLLLSMYNKTPL